MLSSRTLHVAAWLAMAAAFGEAGEAAPPYPPSPAIESMVWHWDTHRTAAPGSDLWPTTWGPDGGLYAAWGDGGGFGGTNSDGRVSLGFARIEGPPESFVGANLNGGRDAENPASFPTKGKTGGILCVDGVLYARLNLQDGVWPDVNHGLAWSEDLGKTWQTTPWVWPKGDGNFKPTGFLNFGKDYSGVPAHLGNYVFVYGTRQGDTGNRYLARVLKDRMRDRGAYEFFGGLGADGLPLWSSDVTRLRPVFSDPNGTGSTVTYHPVLKRYLLCGFHGGPASLGIFDAPEPWGPWTTVAYYDDWGEMGKDGHGLTCDFPQKWMSADGLTMWCVFSVYGEGAKVGIRAHDCFNLVKVTLERRKPE